MNRGWRRPSTKAGQLPRTGVLIAVAVLALVAAGGWVEQTASAESSAAASLASDPTFVQVDSSYSTACAIRTDNTLVCWGRDEMAQATPPTGTFKRVAVSSKRGCAIRTDNTLACWGTYTGETAYPPPTGTFTQISADAHGFCGVRTNGELACWNHYWSSGATDGTFIDVDPGDFGGNGERGSGCGVRTDLSVTCWGPDPFSPLRTPPAASFTQVAVSSGSACGLRTDGAAQCWGLWPSATPGPFVSVTPYCGLRTDGAIVCWSTRNLQPPAPTGQFSQFEATCGVLVGGTLKCWGEPGPSRNLCCKGTLAPPLGDSARFVPVNPTRAYDSRAGDGPLRPDEVRRITLPGVPGDAIGITANLTAVNPAADGFLTAHPCGALPDTSSVNFATGKTAPNQVTVGLDSSRDVCVFASATVDVIVDTAGWWRPGAGSQVTAQSPTRLVDTRNGDLGGRFPAGVVRQLALTVPAGTTAVSMNVTAVHPATWGYVTVWPCDVSQPDVSNLNLNPGDTRPNHVTVALGASRQICIFTDAHTDILVDLTGTWSAQGGSELTLTKPYRNFDSRCHEPRCVGGGKGISPTAIHSVFGVGCCPTAEGEMVYEQSSSVVYANVTAVGLGEAGWASVYPCKDGFTGTSTLNFSGRTAVANAVIVDASRGGVCVKVSTNVDILFDVFGRTS
jgi:hypothetical protein